jgi:hypothetical protein
LCDADDSVSQGYTSTHVKARTKKAFERIYKSNQSDVLEAMSEMWQEQETFREHPNNSSVCGPQTDRQRHCIDLYKQDASEVQLRIFEILDSLVANAQSVVGSLTDLLSAAFPADKGKVTAVMPSRSVPYTRGFSVHASQMFPLLQARKLVHGFLRSLSGEIGICQRYTGLANNLKLQQGDSSAYNDSQVSTATCPEMPHHVRRKAFSDVRPRGSEVAAGLA